MTAYERKRAWELAHPETMRASKRDHMRRKRAALRAVNPDFRRAEYDRTKFQRATMEAP